MPRPVRLNLADIPQHITQRGNNRQICFFTDDDYRLYLKFLAASCQRNECELHAYVLMTNHVHLLITPRIPEGASLTMRDLGRDYVRTINKRHGRSGTMWEGRFKSSLVDTDQYCLACYRYIELNPVRAGIVRHPGDYPWSSFRSNTSGVSNTLVTPHDTWVGLGKNSETRKRAYLKMFGAALDQHELDAIRHGIAKGLPTGSDGFRANIEQALSVTLGSGRQGRPRKDQT